MRLSKSILLLGLCTTVLSIVQAQTPAANTGLTIGQAVERALQGYPSIRVSQEQMNAAAAGIRLAQTAYLPRVDALAQFNRATRNNLLGLVLPQSNVPSISGPVLGTNNLDTAWGSAIGVLVSWEPFDFGERRATIAAATSARLHSEATLKRTKFEVATAAADAYLTLAAAEQTMVSAQAGVERSRVLARIVDALAKAELRPGADASRAQAELALSENQLLQAQQAADIGRATLAQFLGIDANQVAIAAARLLELPRFEPIAPLAPAQNPIAGEQNATVEVAKAQLRVLERAYFPRFLMQGAAYGRGTGALIDGNILGGLNGLAPTVQDYAIGITVSFPILDFAAIRARELAQSSTLHAEQAHYEQILRDLKGEWDRSVAKLEGTRRIAANTPKEVIAAQAASDQANARYQSGLSGIVEVAEAQRILTEAQIDDSLAKLSVWRALLGVATAVGDIQPFLAQAGQ